MELSAPPLAYRQLTPQVSLSQACVSPSANVVGAKDLGHGRCRYSATSWVAPRCIILLHLDCTLHADLEQSSILLRR